MRWLLVALVVVCVGCDDNESSSIADIGVDSTMDSAVEPSDGAPDVRPTDAHPDADPDSSVDAGPDSAPPDAEPPAPRCSAPPPAPIRPTGPLPPVERIHPGVDAVEASAWQTLRDTAMADPGVHFVATFDHTRSAFVIHGGRVDDRRELVFQRVDGPDGSRYTVLEGQVEDIFFRTDPELYGDYAELLAAFENPDAVEIADYPAGDPRIGWLPLDAQSWPDPLVRIGSLFDALDAPDVLIGQWPWSGGGVGTHGGLGLLQSRSMFVVSGRGARQGVVIDRAVRLVDAAPTALAALAVPTTGGLGPDGIYDDGLYLRRQDGQVRWEALDPDPCVRPDHVVLLLFDGLVSNEINHLMLADDPPVELPTFREIAREGAVYRHGAVVGFPTMSAPGHTTAGTGAWPGHHGVVGNAFYGRAEASTITPFEVLTDLPGFFAEPQRLYDLFDRILSGDAETISEALERATGGEAFTVVLNEITVGGADYNPLDHFGIARPKAGIGDSERIDALGQSMLVALLGDQSYPAPDLLQIALVATDPAGEQTGPHSEVLREQLLTMDARVAAIREAYARRGVLDRTLFIIVSDHGMELQDPTRRANMGGVIQRSGVKTRYVGSGGIWLATMDVQQILAGDGTALRITGHDDGRPVEGATLTCADCEPVLTDADGVGVLPADAMDIEIDHPGFNRRRFP